MNRSSSADRHDWHSWQGYLDTHERRMRDFEFFVEDDGVRPTLSKRGVLWRGILACAGGLRIKVNKTQETMVRNGRQFVRTSTYEYHVYIAGDRPIQLFRYDNAPHHDHPDRHHKHEYDSEGRERLMHVGVEGWPTFGEVIKEAIFRSESLHLPSSTMGESVRRNASTTEP